MIETLFNLSNVSFAYPEGSAALSSLSLCVLSGERICILGANGCGKSTLLKMLSGLLFPDSGEFRAFGEKITKSSFTKDTFSKAYHRRVGFIFQDSDIQLFCSTVRDEIAFGLLQLGFDSTQVRKRTADIAEMLDIVPLLEKTPFRLSGGEKKKAAIASVLVLNPDVLILDEPTNTLDPKTQRWLIKLLLSLNQSGKTLILSTHNLELAKTLSNRAVLFNENHKIAADRATGELLRDVNLLREVNLVDNFYGS